MSLISSQLQVEFLGPAWGLAAAGYSLSIRGAQQSTGAELHSGSVLGPQRECKLVVVTNGFRNNFVFPPPPFSGMGIIFC